MPLVSITKLGHRNVDSATVSLRGRRVMEQIADDFFGINVDRAGRDIG
jgi:hypothetical protein